MKTSANTNTATTTTKYSDAPAIYVADSAGNAAGILNLHTTCKASWPGMDGAHFNKFADKLNIEHKEKGIVVFRIKQSGVRVDMAWINGSAETKSIFLEKLGNETLTFNRALTMEEGLED